MAPGENRPSDPGEPYQWDSSDPPSQETRRLWQDVQAGLDKNQTVVWKNAVNSLDEAYRHLNRSEEARIFVEKYMRPIIGILLEQQPAKIGPMERGCVEDSLDRAILIVTLDIEIQQGRKGECKILDVLFSIFNRKKTYYKGAKQNWNMSGLPEVRMRMIEKFRSERGFARLAEYLSARVTSPMFPSLELIHQSLSAIFDALVSRAPGTDQGPSGKSLERDAMAVCNAVMEFIGQATDDTLKKQPNEVLNPVRVDLQKIYDRLIYTQRKSAYAFYAFWRELTLRLITSQSLPLKLFGWEQVTDLISASAEHRPPPRSYSVSGAGCSFVNGSYNFSGDPLLDGYVGLGGDVCFERRIPDTEEGGGKKLTLFRCTMRSQQKWWFLSEADEEQPGTDKDIDYYQHKSNKHEEKLPPPSGWVTCRNAGIEPPPNLRGKGLMVPQGEEYNTLEHQLAKWAIENSILMLVLGDSIHREVVARSTPLIKFLASMCERDDPVDHRLATQRPNAYCLQSRHLLLAWKTCTSKTDAAVSEEVYQLLVSILPSLPNNLAIPLLKKIQTSLSDTSEKRDYLFEVAEFCSALASANPVDPKSNSATGGGNGFPKLSPEVRAEVLQLLWAVLTHPEGSSLKSYENLKRYVTLELRVEPKGTVHREQFLESCRKALARNAQHHGGGEAIDEALALRMVKLTAFLLEACPRAQAVRLVGEEHGRLPTLLFNELTAYLMRRKHPSPPMRKLSNVNSIDLEKEHPKALSERLRILRYAFGLSEQVSSSQLAHLWNLATAPSDREALMVFIADGSNARHALNAQSSGALEPPALVAQQNMVPSGQSVQVVAAAFSSEVQNYAFQDLFCSLSVNWDDLGEEAYSSFQSMFQRSQQSNLSASSPNDPALKALWRICLVAGNDGVASQAMKDLLAHYAAMAETKSSSWTEDRDEMQVDSASENFGNKIFEYLVKVKTGLQNGDQSSERSAERCLRILNAAIGEGGSGRALTSSSLSSFSPVDGSCLSQVLESLPHGMRSQSCYRRVTIMAKRTPPPSQALPSSVAPQVTRGRDDSTGSAANSSLPSSSRNSSNPRFSIDIHPLETLGSVKQKVANYCKCHVSSVRPISVSGRLFGSSSRSAVGDSSQMSLNVVPDDSTVDQLGIGQGCEMVFIIADRQSQANATVGNEKATVRNRSAFDLNDIFQSGPSGFADRLFQTLLAILEALPQVSSLGVATKTLVWDLLLAMPTNAAIAEKVRKTAQMGSAPVTTQVDGDAMMVDTPVELWTRLLDHESFYRSVYVMQVIDAILQPAPDVLFALDQDHKETLEKAMQVHAAAFRLGFINSGGFDAVVQFFSTSGRQPGKIKGKARMANAVALRILKSCLFGNNMIGRTSEDSSGLDDAGRKLLQSLSDTEGLLKSLTAMVVDDDGISSSAVANVLKFLRLLFHSTRAAEAFVSLPNGMAEQFLMTLLLWEGGHESARSNSSISTANKIRKSTHDLILKTPGLSSHALPWLIAAMDDLEVTSDATSEYFAVLRALIQDDGSKSSKVTPSQLKDLGTAICKKLASCPRPTNDGALIDFSTGVLCGCLKLLRSLVEKGGGIALKKGTTHLLQSLNVGRWSDGTNTARSSSTRALISRMTSPFRSGLKPEDVTLIDLMGVIFDGFLSPGGSSSVVSICCDKESRQLGFDVIAAAARSCSGQDGYYSLVTRIYDIVVSAAPYLRHRWGHSGAGDEGHSRSLRTTSKYSGLRNQGCTCYMNSVLQQLFMMPGLRSNLCDAGIPSSLRTAGGGVFARGSEVVGKKIALQWDNGSSYDAIVESFDESTGMHTIRYCSMQVATVSGSAHQQVDPDEIAKIPREMSEEFFLSEGRPGKETGIFEVLKNHSGGQEDGTTVGTDQNSGESRSDPSTSGGIQETEDEVTSRHLLEEVQRTFIHLDEGSRGRCFDPRALVEACNCLKLEFDVWQQNDASEFAMKLLDRLEISMKRWAPSNFRYLEHTFGLKQAKQKICKECGLKTNREENLMSIDCQIRGKSDIHEALSTMCEVEYMEGDNRVFCDRCKKNTDTVLRTAISALPDVLILSLKRFDLDYNTFETVKLNSRCAFGQTLNMKRYTLEGVDAVEQASRNGSPMDTEEDNGGAVNDPLSSLPDEDYEYKLAGVLVHAGVAQGGHYYSFIRDRASSPSDEEGDKWYRFDDEDVTPFDPSSIEVECFGGKVKKETKYGSGQVHTVESEQYANALMLFYEKVTPAKHTEEKEKRKENGDAKKAKEDRKVKKSTGFDVFEADVRRSNATHRWQTFLFDAEFQQFLNGLLGLCLLGKKEPNRMDVSTPRPSSGSQVNGPCRTALLQMILSFVFDILLYSAEKNSLDSWVEKLSAAMVGDPDSATVFLKQLAARTHKVSANWLRTYLADCPEPDSRVAASRIFTAAIRSCSAHDEEQAALRRWSRAWKDQVLKSKNKIPTNLEGEYRSLEDLDSPGASAVGVIVSYLTALIELAPRTWRYISDLGLFIRDLSSTDIKSGGAVLREAMTEAQIPARLVCLIIRDKVPPPLRSAFPGASASVEAVETQIRPETNPSTHLMPLSQGQVMTADVSSRGSAVGSPSPSDYLTLFEALGFMLQIDGVQLAELVVEVEDSPRSRLRFALTDQAAEALKVIFQESIEPNSKGMERYDIEAYLRVCGVDSSTVPPQRIIDILSKYQSSNGMTSKGGSYLSVDGFLAYYRDTAQSNESRVRSDLHEFGFRPNLSRRPRETRRFTSGNRELYFKGVESVAFDVANTLKRKRPSSLGHFAEMGLESFHLFVVAYRASDILGEYILTAAGHEKDTSQVVISTLKAIYCAPSDWSGNETWSAAVMILKAIAAIPDGLQQKRIAMIMESSEKTNFNEHGIGLLVASKGFYNSRPTQQYSSDPHFSFDRYRDVIGELFKLRAVSSWMSDHRPLWSWMEQEVFRSTEIRGNPISRRDGGLQSTYLDHHHSDSGMEDSGPEMSDGEYEEMDTYGGGKVLVERAGLPVINGTFEQSGTFDGVGRYVKEGLWKDRKELFSMFRCHVSDKSKRWYISIVPKNVQPGMNTDIDFYSAPAIDDRTEAPPATGWVRAGEGVDPAPKITWKPDSPDGAEHVQMWNSTGRDRDTNSNGSRMHI